MKTIRVVSSIIFLMLSGCAYTEYRSGYAGYGGRYMVDRSYDYGGYGGRYFSPGTSFIYERSYLPPRFDHSYRGYDHYPDRHHEFHRDWQAPMYQPRYFDGGHGDWSGWRGRSMDGVNRRFVPRERDAGHAPDWAIQDRRQPMTQRMPEQHQQEFHGNRMHGDDGDHRGRGGGHYR